MVNPASTTLAAGRSATASLFVGTTTSANVADRLSAISASLGVLSRWGRLGVPRMSLLRAFSVLAIVAIAAAGIALNGCGGDSVSTAPKGTYTQGHGHSIGIGCRGADCQYQHHHSVAVFTTTRKGVEERHPGPPSRRWMLYHDAESFAGWSPGNERKNSDSRGFNWRSGNT